MNESLELGFKAELLRPLAGGILPFNAIHTQSKNLQSSFIGLIPGATNLQPSFGIMGLHSDQRRNSCELPSIRFS